MRFYQTLISLFLFMAPIFLYGTIYREKPSYFHPSLEIVGCFLEYEDKILLLHRQDTSSQGNFWGIPGGKLEKSETPINAAIRETKEETGFDISANKIIDLGKVYVKYPRCDFIYHMVKCKLLANPSDVKINFVEHKGFTWVTPSDALRMDLMLDEDECIKLIYD